MKMRNKKTGEIRPAEAREDGIYLYHETGEQWYKYDLETLAKWWEYYEEPKEFWHIGQDGVVFSDTDTITQDYADRLQEIGNYFLSREEAERAVEKLKAWKRLKDKGFRFTEYHLSPMTIHYDITNENIYASDETTADLDLLFGGAR